jgi:hypothetical protein
VCLSLAWAAYGAGTIPVGAALVDGSGVVVAEGRIGVLASALLPAFYLRRKPTGHVVRAFERQTPDLLAVAESMLDAGAQEMAAAGVALPAALPSLWRSLAT